MDEYGGCPTTHSDSAVNFTITLKNKMIEGYFYCEATDFANNNTVYSNGIHPQVIIGVLNNSFIV